MHQLTLPPNNDHQSDGLGEECYDLLIPLLNLIERLQRKEKVRLADFLASPHSVAKDLTSLGKAGKGKNLSIKQAQKAVDCLGYLVDAIEVLEANGIAIRSTLYSDARRLLGLPSGSKPGIGFSGKEGTHAIDPR